VGGESYDEAYEACVASRWRSAGRHMPRSSRELMRYAMSYERQYRARSLQHLLARR
jgi:hypothetical protein